MPGTTHHSRPRRLARSFLVRLFHSLPFSGLRQRTLTPWLLVSLVKKRPDPFVALKKRPDPFVAFKASWSAIFAAIAIIRGQSRQPAKHGFGRKRFGSQDPPTSNVLGLSRLTPRDLYRVQIRLVGYLDHSSILPRNPESSTTSEATHSRHGSPIITQWESTKFHCGNVVVAKVEM